MKHVGICPRARNEAIVEQALYTSSGCLLVQHIVLPFPQTEVSTLILGWSLFFCSSPFCLSVEMDSPEPSQSARKDKEANYEMIKRKIEEEEQRTQQLAHLIDLLRSGFTPVLLLPFLFLWFSRNTTASPPPPSVCVG